MRLKTEEARPKGLLTDQAGATMVMGVFIAVMLVGMIYYVWGIGDVILHRERMQDASDTAAFSAAVIHARGMNMIALLNIVMAALAFVAATMATITAMIQAAFAAATFVCAFCGPWCGWCCSACPYAVRHGMEYRRADAMSDRVDSFVEAALRGMRGYAIGIRNGVPIAAQAKVVSYGAEVYSPVTTLGVMAPPHRLQLPTQDDETNWPCREKVLPWVRPAASAGVWLFGSPSPYMAGGIAWGLYRAPAITDEWCEDGYFQRITDDAQEMGNDEYQVQAYMIGDHDFEWSQTGVAVATWGEGDDAGSMYSSLTAAGQVGFAQGEFFYDYPEEDWREWLWHQKWRARLRRWRLSATGVGSLSAACGGSSACGALGRLGSSIDSVVIH
ncbi:MAG: pilus assembly protein TadG-related protein [Myxococcota bacterium]|nr:pilus assembly protein TadG-related protein [Myxococcota bacterium]